VLDSVKHSGSRAKKRGAPFNRPDALRRALQYQLDSKTLQNQQASMPPPEISRMGPRFVMMNSEASFYGAHDGDGGGGGGGGVTSFDGGEIAALENEREEARRRGDHAVEQQRHVQVQQAQRRAAEYERQARRVTAQEQLWRAQALQAEHLRREQQQQEQQEQQYQQQHQQRHQQRQQHHHHQRQYEYGPQYGHMDHRANQAQYYHQHQQIQQMVPPHPGYYTAGAHQMMAQPFMASQVQTPSSTSLPHASHARQNSKGSPLRPSLA